MYHAFGMGWFQSCFAFAGAAVLAMSIAVVSMIRLINLSCPDWRSPTGMWFVAFAHGGFQYQTCFKVSKDLNQC